MERRALGAVAVHVLTVGLLAAGCGGGGEGSSPSPPPEDPSAAVLRAGTAVKGPVKADCEGAIFSELENLNFLCELFGTGSCINHTSACNDYRRQVFTGTTLLDDATAWSGRGGSGPEMADAALCTLRELSPKAGGSTVHSEESIDLGIGKVVAKQDVGYLDFDRINAKFSGYRKLRVELPVLGKFDAVSQDFDVIRAEFGGHAFNPFPFAGKRQVLFGYGLNVATEEKSQSLTLKPPAFDVTTPIGIFEAQPEFHYESHTGVADTPLVTDHTYVVLPPDADGEVALRLDDVYGILPGVAETATVLPFIGNYKIERGGWLSQLGLGNRGTGTEGSEVWTAPSSGTFSRPDYDPSGLLDFVPYRSRSAEEEEPSVYAKASAVLTYPDDPYDLLPSWVGSLPGVSATAYIQVTPTIEAGAAGQFGLVLSEGANHYRQGELGIRSERLAAMGLYSGVKVDASFFIDTMLRIKVSATYPWPVENIDLIDISPHFPIPLAGGTPDGSAVKLATAYSTSDNAPQVPEALDSLVTFVGAKADPKQFIQQCYAKENEIPPEDPPETTVEKGNPEDLFAEEVWPCNICLATGEVKNPLTGEVYTVAHAEYLLPAQTLPTAWSCDAAGKSGCMDLCTWDKTFDAEGKPKLVVFRGPDEIAAEIPASDPLHDFFLGCKLSCEGPVIGLPPICSGGPKDTTPPGIMVPPAPCGAPAPVPVPTNIAAQFTEILKPATVDTTTFTVADDRGAPMPGVVDYDPITSTATFTPDPPLANGAAYTVTFGTGLQDLAGNSLEAAFSCSFETEPAAGREPRTAFVTSVQGNGDLSAWPGAGGKAGLQAADAVCQAQAAEAGLAGTFVAWLSDAADDAYCRAHNLSGKKSGNCGQAALPADAGPWVRTDGFPLAAAIDELVSQGAVYGPPLYDQAGTRLPGGEHYLTGTQADGTYTALGASAACYDWTSNTANPGAYGIGGWTDGTTYSWTHDYSGSCSSSSWRLLCLETGPATPLPVFAREGKKAFVTSVSGTGDLGSWPDAQGQVGIAAGDAICRTRAEVANLPNAALFKAWVSDRITTAKNRLTSGGPWVRPDGVLVAENLADLTDGTIFTALSQTELGDYLSATVWTNTRADGTRSLITSSCGEWAYSGADKDGAIGSSSLSFWNWSQSGYGICSSSHHLYCFED